MSAEIQPYRFALLAHSTDIVDIVLREVDDPSCVLEPVLVDFNTAVPKARECLENGAEVVICHGGTGNSVLRAIGHSVVAIDRTDMDVIKTIRQAGRVDRNIILAAYLEEEHDIPLIEELLDVRIHHASYPTSIMLFKEIDRLFAQGVRVLVGGGVSKKYMEDLGGVGFVIAPNRGSIMRAMDQAKALAAQKRRDSARHENLLAIFRQLDEGVMCVSGKDELIFINRKARGLLKLPAQFPKGMPPEAVQGVYEGLRLPVCMTERVPITERLTEINGEQFVVTTLPVSMQQGVPGAVALFRDVRSLQKINRKIGEELYAKGFVSRFGLEDIKGTSAAVHELKNRIPRLASVDAAVLIHGETGTGKELIAHALHAESRRSDKPFVAVNFAALSEHLLESELFGYEEGAFTGARRGGKAGLFELADGGTLFLDEVGEISHEMQLRLLRVLEAREVMRVGGNRFIPVDVRVVSASHKALPDLVSQGKFRADLFYRLSTLKLHSSPLRERLEDAPLMVEQLFAQYGKSRTVINGAIREIIHGYHWPGNIREFLAVMESYLVLLAGSAPEPKLFAAILKESAMPGPPSGGAELYQPDLSLRDNLHRARQRIIAEAIRRYNGDKRAAALALDVSYSTLWRNQPGTDDVV